jgi:hypothetical protein
MKTLTRILPIVLLMALVCASPVATHAVDGGNSDSLPDETIVAGLKEALEVATTKAIALTGKHDGFLKNEDIRILLPPKLASIGKGMRMIGLGEQVDDLEIDMNRAAEQATPQAKDIFLSSLKKLPFHDPHRILDSSDTAASDYFRGMAGKEITDAFTPIVHHAMERNGVIKQYRSVMKNAPSGNALATDFDLDGYVVEKTLDGIFLMVSVEEKNIRTDPEARTSDLLKEVFAKKPM